MKENTYTVRWVEYHECDIKATSEEEAIYAAADYADGNNTLCDSDMFEVDLIHPDIEVDHGVVAGAVCTMSAYEVLDEDTVV